MDSRPRDPPKLHLRTARDRYLTQLEADGRSVHTLDQARRYVELLLGWIEETGSPSDVRRLTHEHLARFLVSPAAKETPTGKPRKTSSANTLRSTLRVFFRFVHDAGYSRRNIARLVRLARGSPAPRRTLADEEIERLLAAVDASDDPMAPRDAVLMRLLLGTGLRIGSAVGLRAEDIDLDRAEVRVLRAKNDRPINLPVSQEVVNLLREYLADADGGWVFPGYCGRAFTTRAASSRIARWTRVSGLQGRACAHALRHTFACRLYARTQDIVVVQRALGHRSIESTTIYATVSADRLREALLA